MKSALLKKLLLGFIFSFFCGEITAQSNHILWYDKPAAFFEESLVLGNGKLGATVFGGVNSDKIYLNDATLWSGEPVNANMNPEPPECFYMLRDSYWHLQVPLTKVWRRSNKFYPN